jgi:hypothetical protein
MPLKALVKYNKMYLKERSEHPDLPGWVVRKIVKDHLKK